MRYTLVIALAAVGLLLAGCLSDDASGSGAALNASLSKLQADYNQVLGERDMLKTDVATADARVEALSAELEKERGARQAIEARETGSINEIRNAIYNASQGTDTRQKVVNAYKDMDTLGCNYYFLTGGYYTGGNLTIPIQCALLTTDYIKASQAYAYQGDGFRESVQTILNKNYPQ